MKKNIVFLCGGKSPEHRISLISVQSVLNNVDRALFDVNVIGISQDGVWYHHGDHIDVINDKDPNNIALVNQDKAKVYLSQNHNERRIFDTNGENVISNIDALYPVLHGEYGEDGSIQGLAKMAGIPIIGCDILGASATMDKDITKRLLRDAGIRIADFITLRKGEKISYKEASNKLGDVLFIKPVNLGSSVGVSCATDQKSFEEAINTGFQYDKKLVIEEKIIGREVECAVLGNYNPQASTIGEIAPKTDFYTFENKYINGDDGAALYIPAPISDEKSDEIKALAIKAYKLCDCLGMSRVDFFLEEDGGLVLNEINSLPGFTSVSMYPKLWEDAGLPYSDLITKLIDLALEK